MNLDELYDLGTGLVDSYADRNTLYSAIDEIFSLSWDFPGGMPEWVLKTISTDPRDAVMTTARTFATVRPRFKVMPMVPNENNRKRANEIETAIAYNFHQAGRRNDAKVEWDVMMSAAKYAQVAAQVIYLPYQEKILKAMGKDTKRVKASRRFGDFAFIIHNPANVYPEWSEYGLEGVLTVRVQYWDQFVASWGNLADKLSQPADKNGYLEYVTVFDYINYEHRCVWGVCSSSSTVTTSPNPDVYQTGIKILEEENKLGFIPFAIKRWGDSMSDDESERVMPLLQSIYKSGQWDMLNVFESLDASLAIARAAQPQYAAETPAGQDIELDNTEPVGVAKLPPGTRQFTPLPSQNVDQRLMMQKNEKKSNIWQTSVSKILQTLDFPAGTPSSSVNQLLSQATSSLSPYKLLAEGALAEVAHQMLCWVRYYGKEYGKVDLYGRYDDKTNAGREVSISSDTINPDAIQVEVTLTADMPVDKLQQINGAVMLKNNFRIPEAELLEDIVGGDPAEMAKRRDLEDFKAAYIQTELQKLQMQAQLEFQAQQMQMQAGLQQQQQEQAMQAEMQAREQEAQMAQAQSGGTPAQDQMGGLMNNPAAGGVPPVQLANGQA
jgi:hypothetical protein